MKIYVASSWRNEHQPQVVALLRQWGHQVYDFREHGFNWSEVDEGWESWTPEDYLAGRCHHIATSAFQSDLDALWWANACILVMPAAAARTGGGLVHRQGQTDAVLLAGRRYGGGGT